MANNSLEGLRDSYEDFLREEVRWFKMQQELCFTVSSVMFIVEAVMIMIGGQ